MNQTKSIRIIAVRKPTAPAIVKAPVPEYDPNDIDFVVNMVNAAAREQEKKRQAQAQRDRLRILQQREVSVTRREREVSRREAECRIVNFILDTALIGFSILGAVTAFWFCWTL